MIAPKNGATGWQRGYGYAVAVTLRDTEAPALSRHPGWRQPPVGIDVKVPHHSMGDRCYPMD